MRYSSFAHKLNLNIWMETYAYLYPYLYPQRRFLRFSSHCLQLKYKSYIHNIAFSSEKKLSHLNWERNMHRSSTVYKRKQSKTVLNKYVSRFCLERTTGDGLFHWRKWYYGLWTGILSRRNVLKLKCLNGSFVPHKHAAILLQKMLIDGLELSGLLWCFYQLFEIILTAPIHYRGSTDKEVM